MQETTPIQNRLETLLEKVICPYAPVSIDMRWSGIMGMGKTKSPIVRQLSPTTVCAVRMGGMGVAIGSLIGRQAAEMVIAMR